MMTYLRTIRLAEGLFDGPELLGDSPFREARSMNLVLYSIDRVGEGL